MGNQFTAKNINTGVIAGTRSSRFTHDLFTGPNDGLVSVASTKLEDMKDFIAIDVGHSSMRYSDEVADQTLYFLINVHFKH